MIEDVDDQKMIEGLCAHIIELESLRPPVSFYSTLYSLNITFKLSFKKGKLSYFITNNQELYQKIKKEPKHYYKKILDINSKDLILFFLIWLFIIPILSLMVSNIISIIYEINNLHELLLGVIITSISFILFIIWSYTKRKRIAGKKYDYEIKKTVEELILYGISLMSENGLNPIIIN